MGLRDFRDQPRAADSLLHALARGKVAHAYLLVGTEGSGRSELARRLAAAALCQQPVGADACDQCPSCRLVSSGSHPDVLFFLPEKGKASYPVRQLREDIRRQGYLRPAQGARRFLIIGQADGLVRSTGSQNEGADTLLKLLEEPAPATSIVLLAARPERLPATIRSRCQLVRLDPAPRGRLVSTLVTQDKMQEEAARFLVHVAGGDLGLGRSLAGGRGKDRPNLEALRQLVLSLAEGVAGMSYPDLLARASEVDVAAGGWPAYTGALGVMVSLYRDAALRSAGTNVDCLAFPDGAEWSVTERLAAAHSPHRLREAALRVARAQDEARRFPSRPLLTEVLLLDLKTMLS